MSRIKGRFEQLAQQGRKALIPYIVAGDPSKDITVPLMHALVEAGADILELGVPFSDPMAEGPTIQLAHERALDEGTRLRDVLEMVAQFRERDKETPVLLMGYANPVARMGYAQFADAAHAAGIDAALTVDIPPEEVALLNTELRRVAMDNIFLIAPTTPDERMQLIADQASGFIYYVALKGVTGAGHLDTDQVATQLARIRQHTELPLAVGFGIKDATSASAIAGVADGVVVGSALVQCLSDGLAANEQPESLIARVAGLLAEIRRGMDNTGS
ncbi:tryptophan synthase subunit alpha [Parahaliea sp. F7430]|uniref:Tryptophan synthase alpha chain n=1 Tax=Sediminihaliea albiluteola TaxID=2758564 RepID=A0A7W2YI15_9GAMM|nr:tryptophan synthase subunit alpha [Sediminihaliea albiluteola]MBA6412041.1 tryptophan synthase subunit alpha [Sediminihaliea albiluteola]